MTDVRQPTALGHAPPPLRRVGDGRPVIGANTGAGLGLLTGVLVILSLGLYLLPTIIGAPLPVSGTSATLFRSVKTSP